MTDPGEIYTIRKAATSMGTVKTLLSSTDKLLAPFDTKNKGFTGTIRTIRRDMVNPEKNVKYEKLRILRDLLADLWVRPFSSPDDRKSMGEIIMETSSILEIPSTDIVKVINKTRNELKNRNPGVHPDILLEIASDDTLLKRLMDEINKLIRDIVKGPAVDLDDKRSSRISIMRSSFFPESMGGKRRRKSIYASSRRRKLNSKSIGKRKIKREKRSI